MLICILIITINSCSQVSGIKIPSVVTLEDATETPLNHITQSPNINLYITKTASGKATAIHSSATSTLTPAFPVKPTSTPIVSLSKTPVCSSQGIPIQPPVGFGLPGVIIYKGLEDYGMYSVGGSPLKYSGLPIDQSQQYDVFGFSPDGEWLAFSPVDFEADGNIIGENPTIVLLASTGERIENVLDTSSIQIELLEGYLLGGLGFGYWINNDLLYSHFDVELEPDHMISRYESRSGVIDAFDGVLLIEAISNLENLHSNQNMGFSPDLERVLYQSTDDFTLFDRINNRSIWSTHILFPYSEIIDWAQDSSYVAYAILDDKLDTVRVSTLSREGGIETIILDYSFGYNVRNIKWSPDGHYLAIQGQNATGENSIFLYDFKNNQFILQCPMVGDKYINNLIWSPDAKYIAYATFFGPLQVLNIQTGEVIELVDEGMAVGWSNEFPTKWP